MCAISKNEPAAMLTKVMYWKSQGLPYQVRCAQIVTVQGMRYLKGLDSYGANESQKSESANAVAAEMLADNHSAGIVLSQKAKPE